MSEEMAKYEVEELVDDALASGTWNDALKNEYVYEFYQNGRLIRGLTASAISHIAQEHGITIVEVEREILNEGVLYTAKAARGDDLIRHGVAYEPFILNGKTDKFCWQKALTKACRNAMRQLIPAPLQLNAIQQLLTLTEADAKEALPTTEAEALPKPETAQPAKEGDPNYWSRRTFAQFNERLPELEKKGVNKYVFWQAVRERYEVASRAELTDENWEAIDKDLRAEPLPRWITELRFPQRKTNVLARLTELIDKKVIEDASIFWLKVKERTGAKPDTMKTSDWQASFDILDDLAEPSAEAQIPM